MRFLAVSIIALLVGLSFHKATAAPTKKHNHNGRVHSHILPTTGINHFHKHTHNGRAHIHPYSTKEGLKHSHNLISRLKVRANAIKHQHGGRAHSHPLPRTGVKHLHKHRHGSRSHIHPLPVKGANHFHQSNKKRVNHEPSKSHNQIPLKITSLSIKQQMASVLGKPIRALPKAKVTAIQNKQTPIPQAQKRITKVLNNNTINKVLAYGRHQHDSRAHQHSLPATGERHAHKHAHTGRIHSHVIASSNTSHTHTSVSKLATVNTTTKTIKKNVKPIRDLKVVRTVNPVRTGTKKPNKTRKLTAQKRIQRIAEKPVKPIPRKVKQTQQQIVGSSRQFQIALRYQKGTGVKKNLPQAVNWYLRAAKQGNAKAQFNLAAMYENGEGTVRNIPLAIFWYTTAANNGNVHAQINLGNRYARGVNVKKSIHEATKWYRRAANQGDMRARANLNYLLEE